jgi:branched-chain amino acid transport system permease protein
MTATSPAVSAPQRYLETQIRWQPIEIAFWLATLLPFAVFPNYLQLASQIAITALFALSLDLILGYAGIVSLGHAAYFGFGSYTAGLLAKHGQRVTEREQQSSSLPAVNVGIGAAEVA